jgi:hypothetical protein
MSNLYMYTCILPFSNLTLSSAAAIAWSCRILQKVIEGRTRTREEKENIRDDVRENGNKRPDMDISRTVKLRETDWGCT